MTELAISFRTETSDAEKKIYFKRLLECTFYQVTLAIDQIIDKDEKFPPVSRIKTLALTFKKERPIVTDHVQIEEVCLPNDLPRTKEGFFAAMKDLTEKHGTSTEEVLKAGPEDAET